MKADLMSRSNDRRCKVCVERGITSKRKAPHVGPRCATHHRERRKAVKNGSHAMHVQTTYGLTPDEYWGLYEFQGGVCAICRRSTGRTKKLSVDHNHETGEVRSLLCNPCNRYVLGWLRDDIEAFKRCIEYLQEPPARKFFDGPRYVPSEDDDE